MRSDKSADDFLKTVKKKSSKYSFIEDPVLPRKRRNPNYKSLTEYFVVERESSGAEPYYPTSPEEHCCKIYFEIIDSSTQNFY